MASLGGEEEEEKVKRIQALVRCALFPTRRAPGTRDQMMPQYETGLMSGVRLTTDRDEVLRTRPGWVWSWHADCSWC